MLFSGSNFDDSKRETGGMNGCGLKLVNYKSKFFSINTINDKKEFYEEYEEGESIKNSLTIKDTKNENMTEIIFTPSLSKEFE